MAKDESTRRAATRLDSAHGPRGYVLVVALPGGGVTTIALPDRGSLVIGRGSPADAVVEDDSISRKHARVAGGDPPRIEDLGSTNGTRVMGRTLAPGESADLVYGSVVEIGSVVAFVQPKGGEQSVAAGVTRERGASASGPVVRDATMRRLYELLDVVAPSRMNVLVLGETGVGKDVYSEALHARSPRAKAPFVRLNCAALPENLLEAELFGYERGAFTGAVQAKPGLFEAADGGTVFLDEIGEMPLATQAKLLRVLESGEVMRLGSVKPKRVDVRFVAATNRDLEALSTVGQFRSDLFFRLNGVSVTLPPLRRRPDDIALLADHFATAAMGRAPSISGAAQKKLLAHRWPGNIRELKNVIERAVLLARSGPIDAEHVRFGASIGGPEEEQPAVAVVAPVAAPAPGSGTLDEHLSGVERDRILQAMSACGGNQSRAAKMLGISRTTLIKRLEDYGHVRPRKGQT